MPRIMKMSRVALALAVASFALLQGCSSSDDGDDSRPKTAEDRFRTREPVTYNDNAVNADRHFSDSVDASQPNKLIVPTAGNEDLLAKVSVGTILAGDRNAKDDINTSKNPFGFLREVTGITKDGANTVIETKQAELDQWVKNGDIYYNDPTSLFEGGNAGITTKTLHIQTDTGGGSGSGSAAINGAFEGDEVQNEAGYKVKPKISFSNGALQVNAKYDGYFRVRTTWGFPRGVKMKSLLTVDPYVGTDVSVGVQVVGSESGVHIGVTPGITIAEKAIDMPGVLIPIASPIPLTVRFHPRLKCSLSGNGQATVTVRAELRAHAAVGFEADASFSGIDTKDLSESPTLSPTFQFKGGQIQATIGAECEIVAVPEVLAFDALGLSGEVGPYMDLSLTACVNGNVQTQTVDGGFTLTEQHGLQLQFSGRAQVPLIGAGKDFPLLTVHTAKSDQNYLVGNKDTCSIKTKDSCDGRTDGFYCSVENTYSGIVCKGGQVESGLQCDPSKKCVGGTETTIRCN
jgi:hypothetical protein